MAPHAQTRNLDRQRLTELCRVLGISMESISIARSSLTQLRWNVVIDGRMLEQLWPACSVMWDVSACVHWFDHYVGVRNYADVNAGRWRRGKAERRLDWKYSLIAFKLDENGTLAVPHGHRYRPGMIGTGDTVTARWFQKEERWVAIT